MNANQLKQFCETNVQKMAAFCRKEFNVPEFKVITRLSSSERRTRSWGGIKRQNGKWVGYVSIQMNRYAPYTINNLGVTTKEYTEYNQISKHPVIGNFFGKLETCTLAVLAHEVAHALDWYLKYTKPGKTIVSGDFVAGREFKGHERSWQYVYSILRKQFVNANTTATNHTPVTDTKAWPKPAEVKEDKRTNIQKCLDFYRANRHYTDDQFISHFIRVLEITRANAKVYLYKCKQRG